jgi:multiple sugar transport system ATP-binding protein
MTLADRIAVLRDGRLEQVGTPAELYERPNSIFVAGFIGSPKMNFMTGKFAADHGCTTLGIRSEHIDVVEGGIWTGQIVHAEDLGSDNYLFVEVGSDEPLIVRREGKLAMKVGDTVSLAPKAGQLHRFDQNGKPIR